MQITELSHQAASYGQYYENEGCFSSVIQFCNNTIFQSRHSVITLIEDTTNFFWPCMTNNHVFYSLFYQQLDFLFCHQLLTLYVTWHYKGIIKEALWS